MKKYKLIDQETGESFDVESLELKDTTRFVMKVNVGNLSPQDVPEYTAAVMRRIGDFFGGKEKVLIIPVREQETSVFKVEIGET